MLYQLPEEAEIKLLDSYYKSDSFENFKQFFKEMSKQAFAVNLNIYQNIGEFPLVFEEKNAYASISYALHTLTPYAYSECRINHKVKRSVKNTESHNKEKVGFVDFWCMEKDRQFEAYIESKKLWLNIGKSANWQLDSACETRINEAISQIKRLKSAGVDKEINRYTEGGVFKVALFQIPIVYNYKFKPEGSDLESAPKYLESLLNDSIQKYFKGNAGLLLSVLDMRPFGGEEIEGECNPFNALAAVVTQ